MSDSYDILEHGMMIRDQRRLDAYLAAIERTVRPGSVAVDIGCGTGVFAVAACQAGAARVYAIEAGDIIHVARDVVAANGFAGCVEFMQAFSTDVELPELADVVVLDVRGVLPDEQIHVAADARRRLLKSTGTILPAMDELWVAPLASPELYERFPATPRTEDDGVSAQDEGAADRWYKCDVDPGQFLGEPRLWARIDYSRADNPDVCGRGAWRLDRGGIVHGFAVWFDTILCEGVELSNNPAGPRLLYGNGFFPLTEPLAVRAGDTLTFTARGRMNAGSYGWHWTASVD
jgi:protein arginine N-methyltransferase 1